MVNETAPRQATRKEVFAVVLGITLFGGTAQIVFSWLIKATGNPVSPGYYLIAANIL